MSRRPPIASRKRGTWLRTLAPIIMLLTLPCYCIGLTVVGWDRVVVPTAEAAGSRLLDWVFTPVGFGVALLLLLVLLTEPFHGGVTNAGALGIDVVTSIDPQGCLLLLALLFLLAVGIILWTTDVGIPTDVTEWVAILRVWLFNLLDWARAMVEEVQDDIGNWFYR